MIKIQGISSASMDTEMCVNEMPEAGFVYSFNGLLVITPLN